MVLPSGIKSSAGTAYCIGIVLVVMMTGRLVQFKGSLARAVLPLVLHLKWGWHRVERAMERGKVPLDKLFDRAFRLFFAHCVKVSRWTTFFYQRYNKRFSFSNQEKFF